jgi:hypothetical protein
MDEVFEGIPGVVDILDYKDVLAGKFFSFEGCFNNQFSRSLSAFVAFASYEFVGMRMLDFFHEVRKKHKSSLEDAHH